MGLREYIRPRASMDSMRSTKSESGLARTHNRGSKDNRGSGNNWWRGSGLKSKRSWSSFRSTRPDEENQDSAGKDGEVNLNRALPALPGLDQYKERKPMPTHIAQLMRPGRTDDGNTAKQQPVVPLDSYQQFLADAERKARQEEQMKATEERMEYDATLASAKFGLHPNPVQERRLNPAAFPLSSAKTSHLPASPEKSGLRKRFTRFWSHGARDMDGGRKAYGNMVVAN